MVANSVHTDAILQNFTQMQSADPITVVYSWYLKQTGRREILI